MRIIVAPPILPHTSRESMAASGAARESLTRFRASGENVFDHRFATRITGERTMGDHVFRFTAVFEKLAVFLVGGLLIRAAVGDLMHEHIVSGSQRPAAGTT